MGITSGQLRKLGFKRVKDDLVYQASKEQSFVLKKNKTIIYLVTNLEEGNGDYTYNASALVHLDYTSYGEMMNYLRNFKNNSYYVLKNQIEGV